MEMTEQAGASLVRSMLLNDQEPETETLAEPQEVIVPEPEKEPILWHSNAPWVGTGYGTQTALFGPRLTRDLGHPLAFSAFYGLKGKRLGWVDPATSLPFQVYPGSRDGHGNDVLVAHYKHYTQGKPGFCIFLSDVWVLQPQIAAQLPMLAWCPVDHDPVIPQTVEWFKKGGALPVAMSEFGREQLEAAGIPQVQYVPHGFDPDVFKPAERSDARRVLGLPQDNFIVGMVAANLGQPSRKCFAQALQAYGIFHKRHPDTTLYMHTLMEHPIGENLPAMCESLGFRPYSADPYSLVLGAPASMVCAVHNALDVLLNPSAGEGFGVPMIEAQACGTPVITTDFSASPEVAPASVGNWNVEGQRTWTGFNSWQVTPNVEAIVAALEEAYAESAEERQARRVSVFDHAQPYAADIVTEKYWKPVLEEARVEFAWRKKRMKRFEA